MKEIDLPRISIYGSCVSRDTFEFLPSNFELVSYVARQSIISATTPAIENLPTPRLSSPFQARAVQDDFASRALQRLALKATLTDLLLLDLTDERLGILSFPGGRWVTDSSELRNSGLLDGLAHRPTRVVFGTPRHLQLWTTAVQRFTQRLRHAKLIDRTVLIRSPWAAATIQGATLPPFAGRSISDLNAVYEGYYAVMEETGVRFLDLPADLAISDEMHRWTAAPYHYHASAYEYLAHEISRVVGEFSS